MIVTGGNHLRPLRNQCLRVRRIDYVSNYVLDTDYADPTNSCKRAANSRTALEAGPDPKRS